MNSFLTDHYTVKKSRLAGEIEIPPSKSQTLRAILFASLAKGKSVVHNFLDSSDTVSMIQACRLLGAKIVTSGHKLEISGLSGKIEGAEDVIQAGNSGIVLRFISAIAALSPLPIVITGDPSIRNNRPTTPLVEGLLQLGVKAFCLKNNGFAPLLVQGVLKGGTATLQGEDSQPISALLIASALAEGTTELYVKNPGEKPWVALTLDWFDRLGISYKQKDFQHYQVQGGSTIEGFEYTVPGDFSSAAFPLVAALITDSEICLKNIDMRDAQGDKELISLLQTMGAQIEMDTNHLIVKRGSKLKGGEIDINNFVDAITILSVLACYAEGKTVIRNGAVARQKECNRIASIAFELQKMGASISETADGLMIQPSPLKGASLHSYHDHRMAMSLAVAALGADGITTISPVECVAKTFPTFLKDFQKLGAFIE